MIQKVGNDEFCSNCMDWQVYDEEGKCKKCGKLIKKSIKEQKKEGYDSYKLETPSYEPDEQEEVEY